MVILEISVYFGNFRCLKGIWVILEVLGNFCYFKCIFGHLRGIGSIFGNFGDFRSTFSYFRGFKVFLVILEISRVF